MTDAVPNSALSAKDNLRVLQKVFQCSKSRIDEVLDIVGLSNAATKRVRQFSLGMKQRLSIAISLLHDPELLVLDEPTNGLDPNGIIEMRELLIRLNRECGTTILISSHLLSEIEKLISDLAILDQGRVIFEGPFSGLKQKQTSLSKIIIKTNNRVLAAETSGFVAGPTPGNERGAAALFSWISPYQLVFNDSNFSALDLCCSLGVDVKS